MRGGLEPSELAAAGGVMSLEHLPVLARRALHSLAQRVQQLHKSLQPCSVTATSDALCRARQFRVLSGTSLAVRRFCGPPEASDDDGRNASAGDRRPRHRRKGHHAEQERADELATPSDRHFCRCTYYFVTRTRLTPIELQNLCYYVQTTAPLGVIRRR